MFPQKKSESRESRLALMKRLASHGIALKGRKSRSPPPASPRTPPLQSSQQHSRTHHRTGSEGSIADGAVASSLSCLPSPRPAKPDSAKSLKVKPLQREKYELYFFVV